MDEGSLYQLWIQYTSKNDLHHLEAFLTAFNGKYGHCLTDEKNSDNAPLLRELPSRLLHILVHEICCFNQLLKHASLQPLDEFATILPPRQLDRFVKLVKAFCIIAKHPDNVPNLSSAAVLVVFVELLTDVLELVAKMPQPVISQQQPSQNEDIYSLFKLSGSLLSSILDPHKAWHNFAASNCQRFPVYTEVLQAKQVQSDNNVSLKTVLSNLSTYIVDQLEKNRTIRCDITQMLLETFGCALSGSKENASLMLHDSRVVRCLLTIVAQLPYVSPDQAPEIVVNTGAVINEQPDSLLQLATTSISDTELAIRTLALRSLTLLIYLLSAQIVDANLDFTVVVADCLEAFSKLKPASIVGVQLLQLILDAFHNICNVDVKGHTSSCLIDLHLVSLLSNHLNLCIASTLPQSCCNDLAVSSFRVLRALCRFAKPEKANQLIVDWPDMFAVVRKISNPTQKLLDSCLNLSHPADLTPGAPHTLVAKEMILWLPHLSNDQQILLADRIFHYLFDNHNSDLDLLTCSQHHIVDTILSVSISKMMHEPAFLRLLEIMYKIGAVSLTAGQLKRLISLCRPEDDKTLPHYALPLLQALRLMLRPATEPRPSAIFAFHIPGHAVHVQKLHKLPNRSTFSVFLWLRLTPMSATRLVFRLACKNGSSVEAEIASNGTFLVTQSNPKGSSLLARLDGSILTSELRWHALCIVFTPVRLLASGRVLVFVDGRQLVEPAFGSSLSLGEASSLPSAAWNGLGDLLSDFRIGGVGLDRNNGPWLMGDVLIFDQAIAPDQVTLISRVPYNELSLLSQSSKMTVKPIVHYTARCYDANTQVLEDLSGNGYFALCNISTFNIFDVKEMFGCIGGPGVLFPFIYYVKTTHVSRKSSIDSLLAPVSPTRRLADSHSDSNTVVSCACSCLTELFTGFACRATMGAINWMLANDGFATLGHLLTQLPPELVTADVLTSIQTLIDRLFAQQNEASSPGAAQKIGEQHESIALSLQLMLQQAYQHVLFNFDIWAKADYVVQVGHLQYIQQLIRPARSWFRQQYPLRYFLDIVRLHFAPAQMAATPNAADVLDFPSSKAPQPAETESARQFIWQIVRIYLSRNASFADVQSLISFLSESSDTLVCECLDTIKACLDIEPQPDQLVLLLYEPQAAELLFSFLVTDHSKEVNEKALQVINLLLSTKRVYEAHKSCFQLGSIDFFGILDRMPPTAASESMLNLLFSPMFYSPENVNSLASVLFFLPKCNLDAQRTLLRKLISHCRQNPNIMSALVQQCRWQPLIANVFVRQHIPKLPKSLSATPSSPGRLTSRPDVLPRLSGGAADDSQLQISGHLEVCLDNSINGPSVPTTPLKQPPQKQTSGDDVALIDLSSDDPAILKTPQVESRPTSVFFLESPPGVSDQSWQQNMAVIRASSPRNHSSSTKRSESYSGLDMSVPLSEAERSVLAALLDFLQLLLATAMPRLSFQEQIREVGILVALLRDLETTRPILKSSAAVTSRLFGFLAHQMLSFLTTSGNRRPSGSEGRQRSNTQSSPPRNQIPRDALSHYVDLLYDACSSPIYNNLTRQAEFFTPELLNAAAQLLSLASVWDDESLGTIGQVGLAILLQFCCQPDLDLSTAAAEQVQTLLQTSCFIKDAVQFGYLITVIYDAASNADSNVYYTLMPILKTALARMRELVGLRFPLPTLQIAHGSFSESFQSYSSSSEWSSFINFQALPWKAKFMADYLSPARDRIAGDYVIWQSDAMTRQDVLHNLVSGSWASFQERILHPFMARTRGEHARVADFARLLIADREIRLFAYQHLASFQMGDCGPWSRKTQSPSYWKLGALENINRMRLAMVRNFNFDQHASSSLDAEHSILVSTQTNVPPTSTSNDFSGLLMAIRVDESSRNDEDDWTSVSALDAMPSSPGTISSPTVSEATEAAPTTKAVVNELCDLVTIAGIIAGRLEVTAERFAFTPSEPMSSAASPVADDDTDQFTIQLPFDELKDVFLRRYNLQKTALEVFLTDCRNYMFNFPDKTTRNKVFVRLFGMRNRGALFNIAPQNAKALLKTSGATQKWVNREMSNFDYLMALNTFAGRTYNDLSQYPVFPWIIADYMSQTLDLNNETTFRDLSKPMGVQNKKREQEIRDKYDHFEDPTGVLMHKFHYGTHYSNAATVMYYLLRVEPFATLHIDLQSGHFDVPDRLFNSIPGLWRSLYDGNDVKELIPEFFYMPEFLLNINKFDFGRLQLSEERVDNVHLPPWADSPEDFIYKHRQALESDYVSSKLHQWIDLIFGYKQRGDAAVDALNVYHACTYEDQIDLNSITDPDRRKAIEMMVTHFGQTPSQLFTDPHPRRLGIDELFRRVAASPTQYSVPLLMASFSLQAVSVQTAASLEPISYLAHAAADSLVAVTRSGTIRLYTITGNRADTITIQGGSTGNEAPATGPRPTVRLSGVPKACCFAVLDNGQTLAVVGYHDNSLRLINSKSGKLVAAVRHHALPVTCLSLSRCHRFIATGSADVTVAIFRLIPQSTHQTTLLTSPHCVLFGHDAPVTAVALSSDLDLCWSGAENGLALAHTVRKGRYVRSIRLVDYLPGIHAVKIEAVKVSPDMSEVVFYASTTSPLSHNFTTPANRYLLCVFTTNGRYLASLALRSPVCDFSLAGDAILFADARPRLSIRRLFKFQQMSPISQSPTASTSELTLDRPATALTLARNLGALFVALDDGRLVVISVRTT